MGSAVDDDGRAVVVLVKVFCRRGGDVLLVQSPHTQEDQEHRSWAASKIAFLVKSKVTGKKHERFGISQKVQQDPTACVKWLVLTKREIRKYVATGERMKATQESGDNCGTDEEP